MSTNLHDKMLAAIDAYFSASRLAERDQAEEQLLDVRDEINKHKLAEQPVQQEPVAWRYTDARGYYRYRGFVADFDKEYPMLKPQALYTTPQAQPCAGGTLAREPLPYDKNDMEGLDANQRLGFKLGWKSAEAAHGINTKGGAQ